MIARDESVSVVERWKVEGQRCSACNKPLYSRWSWMIYRLRVFPAALRCARAGKWGGAWHWLRQFDLRAFVRGV